MILVSGATGFIGRVLVRHLAGMGDNVRILLRPSRTSPNLPRGVSLEAAVCSLRDERGLRAVMKDVHAVYHLASAERLGSQADLSGVDIDGTRIFSRVAAEAGIERFIYLSHLGAERYSAYPVLKAKAIAENLVISSGVPYTIVRSAVAFGALDQFTEPLARLLRISPGFFVLPGDGEMILQPLWVEDLATCLVGVLRDEKLSGQTCTVGGCEYFSFRQIVEMIAAEIGIQRRMVSMTPAYLRILALWVEQFYPRFPMSIFWLDYLAADRICALDSLPRLVGLMPARMKEQMHYLKEKHEGNQII